MIISFAIMYIIGTYLFVISNSYNTLIIVRFIQGAAILLCTYAFPIYITEISPANRRCMYVTLFQLFWTARMCLSGVIIFFFYNALSWYQYLYITIFLVIVLLGLICILPPSPTWLVLRKRYDDAYIVISKTQPTLTKQEIQKHIEEVRVSLREHQPKTFLQKILIGKDIWPVLLVTTILILNQLTGINFIIFSSELILSPLTNNIYITHIANSLILIVNFGVTILTIFYIDKWGRKKVIFTGLTITLISMILLIVLYSLPTFDYNYILVILFLITCIVGLAFGPSGVIVTLINELLSNRVRIIGIFMAGVVLMLFAFFFIGYFLQIGERYGFNIMFGIIFISSFVYLLLLKTYSRNCRKDIRRNRK